MNPVRDDTTTTAGVKALLTSGAVTACFYAQRSGDRPGCQGLGVVRYGPTTLCGDCDRRRSAVGKGTAPIGLPEPTALLEVIAARDACRHAEAALRHSVSSARHAGHPWSALGAVLGTTRQAAQQRFDEPLPTSGRHVPPSTRSREVINRS